VDADVTEATVPRLSLSELFRRFAHATAENAGSPWMFSAALLTVLVWAATGPFCNYSDTWQLVINTGTTIVTFLIVFLIQNTQNRDTRAVHLKLDELIRAHARARNRYMTLEHLSDEELEKLVQDAGISRAKSA
jgi:low affinity Fe/Cu permease